MPAKVSAVQDVLQFAPRLTFTTPQAVGIAIRIEAADNVIHAIILGVSREVDRSQPLREVGGVVGRVFAHQLILLFNGAAVCVREPAYRIREIKEAADDALLSAGLNLETVEDVADGTAIATETKTNYENLEALCGGYVDYMEPDEDFKILDLGSRPSPQIRDWFDFVVGSAGGSIGLANCYAQLKVATSYTAFRGEMLLSWAQFYVDQKFFERHFCDWVCMHAILWAIENNMIGKAPDGWMGAMTWSWPKMPQINPESEYNAQNNAVKNGYLDYEEILGPDWKERK